MAGKIVWTNKAKLELIDILQYWVIRNKSNKYVSLFMEEGNVLMTGIARSSNYEFVITERKIAAPLFSAYGQSTLTNFKATFDGDNKILLGNKGSEGSYLRVVE
ncbi:MAG TPA: hypothetical protein VFD77_04210 [Brumimicrobium sp.]|nr:hypothetical protein [Brumimicrobium sp.]